MRKTALLLLTFTVLLALVSDTGFAQDIEPLGYKCVSPGLYTCFGGHASVWCSPGFNCGECIDGCPPIVTGSPRWGCDPGTFANCSVTTLNCATLVTFHVRNCNWACICLPWSGTSTFACYSGIYNDSCKAK